MADAIIVIKVGGNSLVQAAQEVSRLSSSSKVIVIHGAGQQIDTALARRGLKTEKINGLRVTDAECLAVVEKEMRCANQLMVETMQKEGAKAVPVDNVFKAVQKSRALGYVGEIVSVDTGDIERCIADGAIAIVLPLGYHSGQVYNINADSAACMLVRALKPSEFIIVNEEGGIKNENGERIAAIHCADIPALIIDGIVTGGMKLKLEEIRDLLEELNISVVICAANGIHSMSSGTVVIR